VLVLGCEPHDFGDELEGRMGLSTPVQAAIEEASNMVEELVGRILRTKQNPSMKLQTVER
jgi:hydrogenase maturation protease